jgi:biopolymer transport protein ExbD
MGKHAPPAPEESVSVNVVPLVDIMFLLLLFLMIGGDMSHRESTELMLPLADKATTADRDVADKKYSVINIHPVNDARNDEERLTQAFRDAKNWQFAITGEEFPDYWSLVDKLKLVADQKYEDTPIEGTRPPKFLSAVYITIRADKSAPYGLIQQAMQACAEAGLYKIEVGAAQPAPR